MRFLIGMVVGALVAIPLAPGMEFRDEFIGKVQQLMKDKSIGGPLDIVAAEPAVREPPEVKLDGVAGTENSETQPENAQKSSLLTVDQVDSKLTREEVESSFIENRPVNMLFQAAWTPFHSESSAVGFAARLTTQLDREFRVIKLKPGHYEVGFSFDKPSDRLRVLNDINAITGYRSDKPPRSVFL